MEIHLMEKKLIEYLPERLTNGLTDTEAKLIESAENGTFFIGPAAERDPEKHEEWPKEYEVRAGIIEWLLTKGIELSKIGRLGVRFSGIKIIGKLNLDNARIDKNIDARNSVFTGDIFLHTADLNRLGMKNCICPGFIGDGLRVRASLFLRNCEFSKKVSLIGANIGGDLDMESSRFTVENGNSLSADGIQVGGLLFIGKGARFKGSVSLVGATIGRELNVSGSSFESLDNLPALFLDGSSIKHNVRFDNARFESGVSLNSTEIVSDAVFIDSEFVGPDSALDLQRTKIGGLLFLAKMKAPPDELVLKGASVRRFLDDAQGWPKNGRLIVDGFVYEEIILRGEERRSVKKRLEWLSLSSKIQFSTQPYEHLAGLYKKLGLEHEERTVRIAKQKALLNSGTIGRRQRTKIRIFGIFMGCGYKPHYAFGWWGSFLLAGCIVFWNADYSKVMVPTNPKVFFDEDYIKDGKVPNEYPPFEPVAYAVDLFIPFVDFHQENYWHPDVNRPVKGKEYLGRRTGWFYRGYVWFHIAVGWILSTLLVAALSGVVKRRFEN